MAIFVNPLNGSITNNPHVKNKFLFPFVTAISVRTLLSLLAIVTGALTASSITIDAGLATRNHVQILHATDPGAAENAVSFDFWPTGDHPNKFDGDAIAIVTNLFGTTTLSAAFTSQLNPNRFVWNESFTLDITSSRYANATLTPFILFTVEDPVSYSMSGSFDGSLFLSVSDGSSSRYAAASLYRLRPGQQNEQIESVGINNINNAGGETFGFEFGGIRTLQVSSNPAVTSLTLVLTCRLRENKSILLFRAASLTALDILSFAWTACRVTITCPTQARPWQCSAWP